MSRDSKHVLYRMRDKVGSLLYVGITMNPMARLSNHRIGKDWFDNVARIDIERHDSRAALLTAEEHAIRTERPQYNVEHNEAVTGRPPARKASTSPDAMRLRNVRMPDSLWSDLLLLAEVQGITVAELVRTCLENLVRKNRRVIEEHRKAHPEITAD